MFFMTQSKQARLHLQAGAHASRAQKGTQRVAIPLGPLYQLYIFRERSHMTSAAEGGFKMLTVADKGGGGKGV